MTMPLKIERDVHVARSRCGRKELRAGPEIRQPVPAGRVPRIARLMALAIRFEQLVQTGQIEDYADLARLGHVSRARISQIMNLLLLPPDIQEELLFLPRIERGRDVIHLRQLQRLALVPDWREQRRMWRQGFQQK